MNKKMPNGSKVSIQLPTPSLIQELRHLWQNTFGDSDAFLDTFFDTAFSFDRCLCASHNDSIVAALYWFDCTFSNQKIAYIYAVATAKEFRGQGICHSLMTHTHSHLKKHGYVGAILSPAEKTLFDFYEKMGYKTCAYMNELEFSEDTIYAFEEKNIALKKICKEEFTKLRPSFLPKHAVLQENENLDFLETHAEFYTGNGFLLTAQKYGEHLQGIEFLGDISAIPSILQTLYCSSERFRTMGTDKPFGMYYPFIENASHPSYIGFIFD